MFTEKQVKLFWSRLDKSGDCWVFIGKKDKAGYGHVQCGGKFYTAHRLAYEISTGDNPSGFVIMHTCDNPPCCNPDHLRKGTHKDNMDDMFSKGRNAKIFQRYTVKLSLDLANEIRKLFSDGLSKHALSRKYNVTTHTIRDVINNLCWHTEKKG